MDASVSNLNPFSGNPLRDRRDLARALMSVLAPLRPHVSPSGARVVIDASAAGFDRGALELEGYARPLWGLVPATMGGFDPEDWWSLWRAGLAAGTDPGHPDFWGDAGPADQRLVEMAAIGFALRCCRRQYWDPLDGPTQDRVVQWLTRARGQNLCNNNWKFFRLMIDLGLDAVGAAPDPALHDACLDAIDGFALPDGWYRDGPTRQVDHYVGFAFHTYGLLYAALATGREERRDAFRRRARAFAPHFASWFADDGAALPIGRSLTYRFATAAFWGALAFGNEQALPWGRIKGLYLRHMRWWGARPIARRDGLLTVGYAYPNALMAEGYNSANSPFWACKAFLPLALGEDHPFWSAREEPVAPAGIVAQVPPGLIIRREPGQTVALASGQSHAAIRHGPEKYAKFAYSTRHAFSIESDLRRPDHGTLDSMLGLIDAEGCLRVRASCEAARIGERGLWSRWRPFRDVEVSTWLWWHGPWQMRRHRIVAGRPLRAIEGGFAISAEPGWREVPAPGARSADPDAGSAKERGAVAATREGDWSGIVDLAGPGRRPRLLLAQPNTHLLHPLAVVPQLRGALPVGETVLGCAVLATPDCASAASLWHGPLDLREACLRFDLPVAETVPVGAML